MKTSIALAGVVAALQLFAGVALAESPEAARAREQRFRRQGKRSTPPPA
jgi:hypothetical protein